MIRQEPKICIIDDNQAVCEALKFSFDSCCKRQVEIYNDPLLFLNEFSSSWTGCLIVDLYMPSLNGLDLLVELKARDNHMNIIIISGHADNDTAAETIEAGAQAFLAKPFLMKNLFEKVELYCK